MERLEPVVTSRRIRQRQQCQRCKIKVIEMWSVRGVPSGPRTRKRFLMQLFLFQQVFFLRSDTLSYLFKGKFQVEASDLETLHTD